MNRTKEMQLIIEQQKETILRLEKQIEALILRTPTPIESASVDGLYLAIIKNSGKRPLHKLFRNEQAFKIAVLMLKNGNTYKEIVDELDKIGYQISDSSVSRFWKFIIQTVIYIHK